MIPRIELLLIFKLFTVVLLVNTASKSHLIFIAKRCALQLISNCNILREGMLVFPVFIIQKSDIIWPSFKWKNHEIASRKFLFCSYLYKKPLVNLGIPNIELLFIFKLFTVIGKNKNLPDSFVCQVPFRSAIPPPSPRSEIAGKPLSLCGQARSHQPLVNKDSLARARRAGHAHALNIYLYKT